MRPRRDTSAKTLATTARAGRQYYRDVDLAGDPGGDIELTAFVEPESWVPAQPGIPGMAIPMPYIPQPPLALERQALLREAVRLETGMVPVTFAIKLAILIVGMSVGLAWLMLQMAHTVAR